jgi:hypothetical protein
MIFLETTILGVIELERGVTSRDSLQHSDHLTLAANTTWLLRARSGRARNFAFLLEHCANSCARNRSNCWIRFNSMVFL